MLEPSGGSAATEATSGCRGAQPHPEPRLSGVYRPAAQRGGQRNKSSDTKKGANRMGTWGLPQDGRLLSLPHAPAAEGGEGCGAAALDEGGPRFQSRATRGRPLSFPEGPPDTPLAGPAGFTTCKGEG